MAQQIVVNDAEIKNIEDKLAREKGSMSKEDQALLEAVLAKAKAERGTQPQNAGWTFTWTYRF